MHHGERLRQYAKSKGLTMRALAKEFGITSTAVEQHFKKEKLSRIVLERYAQKFGFSVDSFYEDGPIVAQPVVEKKALAPVPAINDREDLVTALRYKDEALRYKDELLRAKDETIADLRKNVDSLTQMIRFFPNAAQRTMATT